MKIKITEKIQQFLNSKKDYPVLAAFSVGYYSFVFYFSNNFDLVNSWSQFIYFLSYFILGPIVVFFVLERIIRGTKFSDFLSELFTVLMFFLFILYIADHGLMSLISIKRIVVSVIIVVCIWKFKIRIYKYLIILTLLMSIIPIVTLATILYHNLTYSNDWLKQPDHILSTRFVKKPNIYYIQPDGYANEQNLKDVLYHFDNSDFESFLLKNKFTSYNYRSNYPSTLYSNVSCFSMKHHYLKAYSDFVYPRDIIMGKNAVLKVFKNNGYKTSFICERPYFLMNRPTIFYDYYNFKDKNFSRNRDGFNDSYEIENEIENRIKQNKQSNNFFFIQKFDPGHISGCEYEGISVEKERDLVIDKLQKANVWLKNVINIIVSNDPNAIIIIGADHAGYVGFTSLIQSCQKKLTNQKLLNSIFGAKLVIKWNDSSHVEYDKKLKTSVNLFRVLFSYLSEDKTLLTNMQSDISYHYLRPIKGELIPYPALDENGNVYISK